MLIVSLILQITGVIVAVSAAILGPLQSRRNVRPAARVLDAWSDASRGRPLFPVESHSDDPAFLAAQRDVDDWIESDGIARPFTWGDLRALPLVVAVDTVTRGQRHSDLVAALVAAGVTLTTVGSIISLWA